MMRRIYHRFPAEVDLDFTLGVSFREALSAILSLHRMHEARRTPDGMIRVDVHVGVANERTEIVQADLISGIAETATEAVDFRIVLNETILTAERKIPHSENAFFLRVSDAGARTTRCFAVKDGMRGKMDAMDLKEFLMDAIR